MTNKKTKAKKGFTIIEVVLVLAIAGLIFLMVFVALPTLQRNQKDTARKNDLDRFQSSLISYISSNNKVPQAVNGAATAETSLYTARCEDDTDDMCYDYDGNKDADSNNTWAKFIRNYLLADGDTFQDQSGDPYQVVRVNYSGTDHGGQAIDVPFDAEDFNALLNGEDGGDDLLDKFTGTIMVAVGASCNKDDDNPFVVRDSDGRRSFAVALKLEAGAVYCLDN